MWMDYMSRLVTQPYVRDLQPRILVPRTLRPVPCAPPFVVV
jgi:hypothetical protein